MTNEARMTEPENNSFCQNIFWSFEPLSFLRHSTFVLRHLRFLGVLASIFYLPHVLVRNFGLRNPYHPSFLMTSSVSARSSNKKSGAHICNRWRDQLPVATAIVRAPNAFPQAMS